MQETDWNSACDRDIVDNHRIHNLTFEIRIVVWSCEDTYVVTLGVGLLLH